MIVRTIAVNKAPMGKIKTTLIGSCSLTGRRRRSRIPKAVRGAGGMLSIAYEVCRSVELVTRIKSTSSRRTGTTL